MGRRRYELSNHLGNILATVSDKSLGQDSSQTGQADYYLAQVSSASLYYPFGWEMPGRKFVSGEEYRFGFNGKEDDRDWGTQNIQDYGFRLYNPSIGKFLSVDPLSPDYPWYTPYQFAGNMPIQYVDLDGLEPSMSDIQRAQETSNFPVVLKSIDDIRVESQVKHGLSSIKMHIRVPKNIAIRKTNPSVDPSPTRKGFRAGNGGSLTPAGHALQLHGKGSLRLPQCLNRKSLNLRWSFFREGN